MSKVFLNEAGDPLAIGGCLVPFWSESAPIYDQGGLTEMVRPTAVSAILARHHRGELPLVVDVEHGTDLAFVVGSTCTIKIELWASTFGLMCRMSGLPLFRAGFVVGACARRDLDSFSIAGPLKHGAPQIAADGREIMMVERIDLQAIALTRSPAYGAAAAFIEGFDPRDLCGIDRIRAGEEYYASRDSLACRTPRVPAANRSSARSAMAGIRPRAQAGRRNQAHKGFGNLYAEDGRPLNMSADDWAWFAAMERHGAQLMRRR